VQDAVQCLQECAHIARQSRGALGCSGCNNARRQNKHMSVHTACCVCHGTGLWWVQDAVQCLQECAHIARLSTGALGCGGCKNAHRQNKHTSRVGQTIYIRCIYGIFG